MSSLAADELIDSSLQLLLRLARNSGIGESPKSHRKSAPRMSSVILSDDSLGVSQLRIAHSSAEIFSIQEEVSIPPLWTDTWVPGFDYDEAQTTTSEKTLLCAPCAPSEPHFAWSSGEKAMHVSINNPMPIIALRDPPPPAFLPTALKQRDACSLLTLPLCFTFTNYLPRSGDLTVRSAMRNALNARLGIDSENVTLRTPSAVSALPHSLLQGDYETTSAMAEDDYAFEDEIRASTSSRPSRAVSRPHATREYTDYMAQEDEEYEEPKQKPTKPKTSKKKKGDAKAITESGEIANNAEGDEISNIGDDTTAPTKKKKRRVKRLDWMEERKPLPVPSRGKRSGDGHGDELIGDDEDGAMETMYLDDEDFPPHQSNNASQSASHSSNKQHLKKEDASSSAISGVDGKSSVQSLLQKSGTSGFPVEGRYKLYGRNSKRAGEEEPITDVPWSWEEKDGLLAIAAKLEKPLDWNAVRDLWNDTFRKDAEPLPEGEDEDQEEPSQERRKSAAQILRQYTALSATPSRSHKTKWSAKDDEKLMEMFDYTSTQDAANELGRSPKAIVERIFEKYSIDLLEGDYLKERYERIEEMKESSPEKMPAWYTSKSTPLLQLLQQSREPVIHSTIASFKPKRGQPTSPSASTPFSELDDGNEVDDLPQSKTSSAKKGEKKSRWKKERDDDSDEDFDISMVPTKPSSNKGKRSHPNASSGGKGGKRAKLVEAGESEAASSPGGRSQSSHNRAADTTEVEEDQDVVYVSEEEEA